MGKFGMPAVPEKREPLDELVRTILSQNTNDRNRDRAYRALQERFGEWEEVLEVSAQELEAIIAPAGLGPTKSGRIRDILERVYKDGDRDLLNLCTLTEQQAMKKLMSIKGVGPKTASCVLLFSCGHPVFPVDTHVFRVARRLGLVPEGCDRVKAHEALAKVVPREHCLELHLNMIRLGREVCRPSRPLCRECPLADLCPSSSAGPEPWKGEPSHE